MPGILSYEPIDLVLNYLGTDEFFTLISYEGGKQIKRSTLNPAGDGRKEGIWFHLREQHYHFQCLDASLGAQG